MAVAAEGRSCGSSPAPISVHGQSPGEPVRQASAAASPAPPALWLSARKCGGDQTITSPCAGREPCLQPWHSRTGWGHHRPPQGKA